MGYLYWSGLGFGVNLRMDTKDTCVENRLEYMIQVF